MAQWADDNAARPITQDPLWNFAFDMLDSMRTDIRYVKEDMRDLQTDMSRLTETTNHRLDRFTEALESKADRTALIGPVVNRLVSAWKKRTLTIVGSAAGLVTAFFVIKDQLFERLF